MIQIHHLRQKKGEGVSDSRPSVESIAVSLLDVILTGKCAKVLARLRLWVHLEEDVFCCLDALLCGAGGLCDADE